MPVMLVQNSSQPVMGLLADLRGLGTLRRLPYLHGPHYQVSDVVIQGNHGQLGLGQLTGSLSQELHS